MISSGRNVYSLGIQTVPPTSTFMNFEQLLIRLNSHQAADPEGVYRDLVTFVAGSDALSAEACAVLYSWLDKLAYDECAWALLLASVLWRHGVQSPADFENHRQFAQFAACSKKFTRLPIERHLELAQAAVGEFPSPAVFVLLGNAHRFLQHTAQAEEAYLAGIQRYPADPFLKLRLADLYLATYKIEPAHLLLKQLQLNFPYAREMLFIAPAHVRAKIPEVFPQIAVSEKAMVWLVAADPVYLQKYARPWLASVQQITGNALQLHIHAVGDHATRLAEPLRSELIQNATLTERRVDLQAASPNQRKALFSCERFLFLAEMLEKYQKPILVTDIDVECVRDPRELLGRMGEADLGYTNFRNTLEAWERYAATALIFRPTEAAIMFCRRLADLLVSALDSHAQPWFIDQIALFRLLEEFPMGVKTCFLENILTETTPPAPSGYFRILHGSWTEG